MCYRTASSINWSEYPRQKKTWCRQFSWSIILPYRYWAAHPHLVNRHKCTENRRVQSTSVRESIEASGTWTNCLYQPQMVGNSQQRFPSTVDGGTHLPTCLHFLEDLLLTVGLDLRSFGETADVNLSLRPLPLIVHPNGNQQYCQERPGTIQRVTTEHRKSKEDPRGSMWCFHHCFLWKSKA